MQALLEVILPVFLVIGFGYVAAWRRLFPEAGVDALMSYTQTFAIPCLLFQAIARLDLGASFDLSLLLSFYLGAACGFSAGLLGGRFLFGRSWPDSVAIGFCCLFSNSVLLGLPITERAYGADALTANFAIVALHAPFCYGIGMTAMEIARAAGDRPGRIAARVLSGMFRNALIIGIGLGLLVNLTGIVVPQVLDEAVALVARSALPAALFGLGGVLVRYRPEGDLRAILFVCAVSLVLHPAVTFATARLTDLPLSDLRSAVLTAAMAPGVNTYIFANMYGASRRVAASAVLLATALSIVTVWLWLLVIP